MNTKTRKPSKNPPKKVVHIFAVIRVPVEVSADLNDEEAVEAAVAQTDLDRAIFGGEYADEIAYFLVDDYKRGDMVRSTWLDMHGKPEIQGEKAKVITVSTGHISRKDAVLLEKQAGGTSYPMVASTGSGYFVSLLAAADREAVSNAMENLRTLGFSKPFLTLWNAMRDSGFGYLQLDQDASTIHGFKTFNW